MDQESIGEVEALSKAFAKLKDQYEDRKQTAESQVCSWHWATAPIWNIEPLYYYTYVDAPGRELKKAPAPGKIGYTCGKDLHGRIVVERCVAKAGYYFERYYDWLKQPVEVSGYSDRGSGQIPLRSIFLMWARYNNENQLVRLVRVTANQPAAGNVTEYQWCGPNVTNIARYYVHEHEPALTHEYRISYTDSGEVQTVEDLDTWRQKWSVIFPQSPKPSRSISSPLNLVEATHDVRNLLSEAVKNYAIKNAHPDTACDYPPVGRIEITFSLGDGESIPWVNLCFDTRTTSDPDGEYSHPDFACLECHSWCPSVHRALNGHRVAVILPDGTEKRCNSSQLLKIVGNALVSCLLSARSDGIFENLPRNGRCELGVEEPATGEFGWPVYEDRGKENLV